MNATHTNQTGSNQMDANVTLKQIGKMTLMACGAREFVAGEMTIQDHKAEHLMFRVGPGGQVYRKIIIHLAANDTYTVQQYKLNTRTLNDSFGERVENVYADMLAETVRRLGDTNF